MDSLQWEEYLEYYYQQKSLEKYQQKRTLSRPRTTKLTVGIYTAILLFVISGFCVALFMIFVWRGFTIAMKCKSKYNALLVVGLVSQVGYQALLNAAVATNAAPNTGISLPFFSYGGTSMLVLLAEMGIILSASRTSKIKKI